MQYIIKRFFLVLFLVIMPLTQVYAKDGTVVVTIKPLHSIVASVMGKTGNPVLLVENMASPHGYAMKPSQVHRVLNADIVFLIDDRFESFIAPHIKNGPKHQKVSQLARDAHIQLLKVRQGGVWDVHHHKTEHEHYAEGLNNDYHVWLDPILTIKMARVIAKTLIETYPEHQSIYEENLKRLEERLYALDHELRAKLRPYSHRPFVVFHDAFQYFESAYNLNSIGSITLEPDQPPSARRLAEIRSKVRNLKVACVFSEPQFSPQMVHSVTEGLHVQHNELDEHGALLIPGTELYFQLMRQLASRMSSCLNQEVR